MHQVVEDDADGADDYVVVEYHAQAFELMTDALSYIKMMGVLPADISGFPDEPVRVVKVAPGAYLGIPTDEFMDWVKGVIARVEDCNTVSH